MKYVDIHTHNNSKDENVISLINFDLQDFQSFTFLADNYYTTGLHPWYLNEYQTNTMTVLEEAVIENKIIAIGECGLDKICKTPIEKQISSFLEQIKISEKYSKPLIIHVVKAYDLLLNIHKNVKPKQHWIIHGFQGNVTLALQLQSRGMLLSFGNALLSQQNVQKTFTEIAKNMFFLETDNSKVKILDIYDKAADLLHITKEELKEKLFFQFQKIFIK